MVSLKYDPFLIDVTVRAYTGANVAHLALAAATPS
jgi:hypothetical protein